MDYSKGVLVYKVRPVDFTYPFLTDALGKGRHVLKFNLMETFISMRACS